MKEHIIFHENRTVFSLYFKSSYVLLLKRSKMNYYWFLRVMSHED